MGPINSTETFNFSQWLIVPDLITVLNILSLQKRGTQLRNRLPWKEADQTFTNFSYSHMLSTIKFCWIWPQLFELSYSHTHPHTHTRAQGRDYSTHRIIITAVGNTHTAMSFIQHHIQQENATGALCTVIHSHEYSLSSSYLNVNIRRRTARTVIHMSTDFIRHMLHAQATKIWCFRYLWVPF